MTSKQRKQFIALGLTLAVGSLLAIPAIGSLRSSPGSSVAHDFSPARLGAILDTAALSADQAKALVGVESRFPTEAADPTGARLLQSGVGRFHSALVAVPSSSGRGLCYSSLANRGFPSMTYCYRPLEAGALDRSLSGQRFMASALALSDGAVGTQVFGIALDDVESIRLQVDGAWRDVPITNNSFYLDLPGTGRDELGRAEATLEDGSKQEHDFHTGG